jgi:hypothetical protein
MLATPLAGCFEMLPGGGDDSSEPASGAASIKKHRASAVDLILDCSSRGDSDESFAGEGGFGLSGGVRRVRIQLPLRTIHRYRLGWNNRG